MKKHLNMNTLYLAAAIIAVSAFMLPRVIEAVNLHLNGISYIADQTEEYYKITEPVEGEYTVELDLNDLENNEGKILYDDGDSQISVMKVVEQEEMGYEVVFRSHAKELPDGAVLVSGIADRQLGSLEKRYRCRHPDFRYHNTDGDGCCRKTF